MNPYEYKVSLRIRHPTIDPQIISSTLGLKPSRIWQAGTPRKTPNGENLEGINKETYWSAQLSNGKNILSEEEALESYLLEKTNYLNKYSGFLGKLKETQGTLEYFIGVFGNKNMGCVFNSELLTSINSLGIEIALDIYPGEE